MEKNNIIKFNDLQPQWETIKESVQPRIESLFSSSSFINGEEVSIFERNFADFVGTKYAIGVSNGTDALKLCIEALNLKGSVGVFIPANTFIASLLGPEMALPNASYTLIDCDDYYQMDTNILQDELEKNRKNWDHCIIIPVHLYGHSCDMGKIMQLSKKYNCWVVEDASQAHGAKCQNGKNVGSIGHMAAFSLYPGKNLGAAGDAGIITTNQKSFYDSIKLLQNWGATKKYYYEKKGYNNRLDTFQAIILDEKIKYLEEWNDNRKKIASWYEELITNKKITKPKISPYCLNHVYHIYAILLNEINREQAIEFFKKNNIEVGIHYPIPIEETKIYQNVGWHNKKTRLFAKKILSLPMHPFLKYEEVKKICDVVNSI